MDFSLQPFWEAEPAVQVHIVCGVLAAVTGAVIFVRRKGTSWHKLTGRFWFACMAGIALSGLFIHNLKIWGAFSPLHIFSITTLIALAYALYAVRQGRIRNHELTLKGLYLGGIVFAGTLSFSKGLTIHRIVFGENGGQFMPAPGELPGGPIGFALVGGLAIFLIIFFKGSRTLARGNKSEAAQ